MAGGNYKLILTGEFDQSRDRSEIRAALIALFQLKEAEVDELLNRAPVTIKTGLDHDTASKYKAAVEQTGALCELREVRDHDPAPASPPSPAPMRTPAAGGLAPEPPADAWASSRPARDAGAGVTVRRVDAGRGLAWWGEGWRLFMASPGTWFVIGLIMMLSIVFLQLIPLVGFLAATLLPPLYTGGVMLGAQEQDAGRAIRIEHLFAGFSRRTGQLLALGGIYFGASIVLSVLVIALMGGAVLGAGIDVGPELEDPGVLLGVIASTTGLLAILLGLLGGFVLMASLWFAPALVMLHEMAPLAAMKASLLASLRNWLPFLVYGLVMIALSVMAILPLGMGYLLLVPVLLASVFAAFRDIFEA